MRYQVELDKLMAAVFDGDGTTSTDLRIAATKRGAFPGQPTDSGANIPVALGNWIDKVALHAYETTDQDVEELKKDYSDDQIFEITVAAALGAAEARLQAALNVLNQGP